LAKYINDTGLFSSKKIDKALKAFSTLVFDQLASKGTFHVEQIGALRKTGSTISYNPTLRQMTDEFKGLSSVALTPINRIQESNEVEHVVDTGDISARPEASTPIWYPLVAGLLIAAAFIAFKKGCYDQQFAEEAVIEQMIEAPDNSAQLIANDDDSLQKVIDTKYEEVDQLIDDSGATKATQKIDEELANLEAVKSVASNDEVTTEVIESEPLSDEVEAVEEPLTGAAKYASIIPSNGRCIIILGSFSKASNTTRMISNVEQANLPLYTSTYNGYTRVGFEVECTGLDLEQYLNDIRNRFSSKAWYLDPSVDIPYR